MINYLEVNEMGIDAYMLWEGKDEEFGRGFGFSVTSGDKGYLREAYHGSPYAIPVLLKECYENESEEESVAIPASVLRSRLPEVIKIVIERENLVYGRVVDENDAVVKAFVDFVELAEKKEKDGISVTYYVSY